MVKKTNKQPKENKQNKASGKGVRHWSKIPERGSYIGLKICIYCYRICGYRLTYSLMAFLMVYFYLFAKNAKKASKEYIEVLKHYQKKQHLPISKLTVFQHFKGFGTSLIDKLAVWCGDVSIEDIQFQNKAFLLEHIKAKTGAVILTAHLGNMEIVRALSQEVKGLKVNALVFNDNAQKFNASLKKVNENVDINLITVRDITPAFAITLKDKVDQGEFVVIAADRTSIHNPERSIEARFLDAKVMLPQGAFVLASVLKVSVYTMLCLREKTKNYQVVLERFAEKIDLPRDKRDIALGDYAQHYCDFLAPYTLKYPEQWFNFFAFWKKKDLTENETS